MEDEATARLQKFKRLKVIGRGAHGVCSLHQDVDNNRKVVIKTVSLECRGKKEIKTILHEAQLLGQLSHPNIIRLHNSFYDSQQLFIIMEYAGIAMGYFTQITLALHYIHAKKILHRDLKSANIFLNRKRTVVKLGDFGISKELSSRDIASTVIGTPHYLSPEICEGRSYDLKSDIWAMGCVLYELVELQKAFEGESFPSIVLRITRGKHGLVSPAVSEELKELIAKLLDMDEKKRPTTKEILTLPIIMPKWFEIHVNLGRIESPVEQYIRESSVRRDIR